jgi:hypothetical protein
VHPPLTPHPFTRDKTAVFSTREKPGEKKFYFFFIEQIVILCSKCLMGKCLSGQMSFWANVLWANVQLSVFACLECLGIEKVGLGLPRVAWNGREAFLPNRVLKTCAPVYHIPVCACAPIQASKTSVHYPPCLRPDVSFDKHTTLTQIRPSLSGAVSNGGSGGIYEKNCNLINIEKIVEVNPRP